MDVRYNEFVRKYEEAIKRNEVRDFFFGKGEYYQMNWDSGEQSYYFDYRYYIEVFGEQKLYERLSYDFISILRNNDVSLSEFHILIIIVNYYYIVTSSYQPDLFLFDWVYPEALTRLFNTNYERLKNEGDTSEIDELLLEMKRDYNIDLMNFDRVNVIGSKTVLPRVPKSTEGEFVVPDGIVRIPNHAFAECDKITSVIMPDTVESIGHSVFTGCISLKNIKMSESLSFIGSHAFGIEYTASAHKIPACSIESIYIPKKVKGLVDYSTFNECMSLKSIEVDSENPYYASYDGILYTKDMKNLICCPCGRTSKVVRIPESVEEIGCLAFCNCCDIEELYIPSSAKKMDMYAPLEGCSGLKRIHIGVKENIEKVFNEFDFEDVHKGCVIYVPKGTKDIYKKVLSESKDVNIIEEDV